ncbi:MAG TPA: type II toxin-antitoxin system HicB family antitoxin [Candidatus Kapabacteria bacterium]|nr:type II toxin-antitoxin system HicB family antitoxin [Candidatus Kapabacteria bacterium]HET6402538.1 type II toxin-antitoxin system HicB family antitoxin [Candidatus Kapabacteria bacterium]
MLTDYIEAAMRHAKYRIYPDNTFYGEIPECPGVCANEVTLEECRNVLQEVLEGWIMVRLHENLEIPVIEGVELEVTITA